MAEKINLQKSLSKVNESLTRLFDESGIRRAFTVPYVEGQDMADHIKTVGAAAQQAGGFGNNLITTSHHSDGKGYGSGDGHTVAHPAESLRNAVIPKGDEQAKTAVDAAQSHLNNIGKLIGDDNPDVKTAKNQLKLVEKTSGAGMTLLDFGIFLTQLMLKPTQAVSQVISGTKKGGHASHLRGPESQSLTAPGEQEESQEGAAGSGEAQGGEEQAPQAPEAQPTGAEAPAAPEAQAAPSGAPAAAQQS